MFSVGAALRDDDWCRQPGVWRQRGVGAEQLRGAVCRGRGLDQGGGRLLSPLTGHDGLARSAAGAHQQYLSIYNMCIQFCSTNGGHLVEILSQEHEDILDQSVFSGLTYWIGLNDIATEGILHNNVNNSRKSAAQV